MDQTVSRGSARRAWQRLSRLTLYALPVVTVAVIGLAVFVIGAPRSYQAVRIWGGPTDVALLSARLQAVERYHEIERPLAGVPIDVALLNPAARGTVFRTETDSGGFVELELKLPEPPTDGWRLRIERNAQLLAEGRLELSRASWRARVRRRGQWTADKREQQLRVRVRPARGVFAVPFADPVIVEVSDAQGPVAGARVRLALAGVSEPATAIERVSDGQGLVQLQLAPREHVVELEVTARAGGRSGSWFSTLPVVPGALHASLRGRELLLRSPVLRDEAFFSVVTERRRLLGGHVLLEPDRRGGAGTVVKLPEGLPDRVWAVVSSEPDLNSPASVGWPLSRREPESTFDAKDLLLMDGLPAQFERSREVPRRARQLAGAFVVLALGLAVVLLVGQVRAADSTLEGHFRQTAPDVDRERLRVPRGAWTLLTAVLCIALGFVIVALVSLARLS